MHDPSASQSLPRLGCLWGTLSPSRRQIRWPAGLTQQPGDLAIAVAAVLPGKLNDIGRETLFVVTTARDFALRLAMLPERRTGAALGNM
jgi:hypothetical protein